MAKGLVLAKRFRLVAKLGEGGTSAAAPRPASHAGNPEDFGF